MTVGGKAIKPKLKKAASRKPKKAKSTKAASWNPSKVSPAASSDCKVILGLDNPAASSRRSSRIASLRNIDYKAADDVSMSGEKEEEASDLSMVDEDE